MSTENNNVETNDVNLDDFAVELFGGSEAAPDNAKSEEVEEEDTEVSNAPQDDDTHSEGSEDEPNSEDNDDLATEEDESDEGTRDESDDDEDGKPKKTRFQKRIDELTAKAREAEREKEATEVALKARIEALEAKLGQDEKPEDKSQKADELVEPKPTDKTEDGEDKYPLGDYDPQYLKDLADYSFEKKFAALETSKAEKEQERIKKEQDIKAEAEKQALQESWTEKLAPAQERYPDFHEKGEALVSTFDGIDASYGEYLSTALMALDNGPDVLYYLASNPDEAQSIVESGPMKATVAMGRIDSMFAAKEEAKKSAPRKVSKAPSPPPANKGSSVAKGSINPSDGDVDLDALARELAKGGY
ncbi:MAG: hypothetical protein Tp1125DCM00d2C21254131_39 [Prokaryotic dsDNA virus sp.]|nr:MAG: hypothetical protein Tp1125DCM00d2C21254131_39 [Prokaryotic dsDNA virus sp.]|tara:strand:- start:226 stop:1308 length:1083 start_codon:yes stop_codon:yes gene_type:complete